MPIGYDVLEAAVRITEAWLHAFQGNGNAPDAQGVVQTFETVFDSVKQKRGGGERPPAVRSRRPRRGRDVRDGA